jgi:hypothetical protein
MWKKVNLAEKKSSGVGRPTLPDFSISGGKVKKVGPCTNLALPN